ncbi:MAG: cell wall hydrolase/autolysin [Herbinix sp.]|jgi:N-acetylmuramoyl-L-alanine amidase|nr:cell wall hydrolase/autolysin [Herbinix sp.]
MPKVILDAGHGGSDIGEYYERRSEKNDNLLLALRIGEFLAERGVDVVYTRTADVYLPMMQRVTLANQLGGDLLVSIHRLSGNSSNTSPNLDFFVKENDKIGESAANNIGEKLYDYGYENYGIIERTDLPLLSGADMPAIMVGIGYVRSQNDNLNYDKNFVRIAEGIADGIYQTIMDAEPGVSTSGYHNSKYHYRVGTGPYRNYDDAIDKQLVLGNIGYETEIHKTMRDYYIYTCCYDDLDDAGAIELQFRRCGFRCFIIRA